MRAPILEQAAKPQAYIFLSPLHVVVVLPKPGHSAPYLLGKFHVRHIPLIVASLYKIIGKHIMFPFSSRLRAKDYWFLTFI